jgi:hypothetical protein
MNKPILDLLSYEIPATLIRYGRSDAQHFKREANRLMAATSYHYSPMRVKMNERQRRTG